MSEHPDWHEQIERDLGPLGDYPPPDGPMLEPPTDVDLITTLAPQTLASRARRVVGVRVVHGPADVVPDRPDTLGPAATHVVIEDDDARGAEGCLDDPGAFRVVALAQVRVVVEAPHLRRPLPEHPAVLIEPQRAARANVADLDRMTGEERGLGFRPRRPLAPIGEGANDPGGEELDFSPECHDGALRRARPARPGSGRWP